jgi:hypothetical protein
MIRSISCSAARRPSFLAAAAALAVAAALAGGPARAGDPVPYTIHQAEPHTGSHLPTPQGTSPVPLDAAYHDLTPEQQAKVRSQYETMADGDEPPYPLRGTGTMVRPLAQAQQTIEDEGMLVLFIHVDAKGEATKVEVIKTPSERIARVAAAIAMATKFKPAVCHGQPCAMGYPWRVKLDTKL